MMDTVSVLITDSVLGKNECCRCVVKCRPADPNLPSSATLALVERQGDFALFFFSNLREYVVESADLKLDNILPVASDFACEETELDNESLGEIYLLWRKNIMLTATSVFVICSLSYH